MPIRFKLTTFNQDVNKIKTKLPSTLHPNLEKVRTQVVELNNDLKKSNDQLKQSKAKLQGKETLITNLKTEINESKTLNKQLKNNLQSKIEEYDKSITTVNKLKVEVANITSEYIKVKELYDGIKAQKQRPVATPTQLSSSFKDAMESMRTELKTVESSPVDYVINRFDVSLKTGIGVDEEDKISFQLPKEDEITNPENLSTIQFSIKPIPKVKE